MLLNHATRQLESRSIGLVWKILVSAEGVNQFQTSLAEQRPKSEEQLSLCSWPVATASFNIGGYVDTKSTR
jgi:hypothetical protein